MEAMDIKPKQMDYGFIPEDSECLVQHVGLWESDQLYIVKGLLC